MKIAILGAGAMGMLFGARLAEAGQDVTLIVRRDSARRQMEEQGIHLEDDVGCRWIAVRAALNTEYNETPDLIIAFTKVAQLKDALDSIRPILSNSNVCLMSLQNGIGNIDVMEQFVPRERILAGVTSYASDRPDINRVVSHGRGYLKFMALDPAQKELEAALYNAFVSADFQTEISRDVFVDIWEKAAFNGAINSVTAICRIPCGGVARVADGRALAERLIDEAALTAEACGVAMSAERVKQTLHKTYEIHKEHLTSMAQDVLSGRKTELSAINGAILAKAHEKGLSIPCTETVCALIRIIEETYDISAVGVTMP